MEYRDILPEQVADELEAWIDETGVDGFNLAHAISPGTFEDSIKYVSPILRERGLVRKEYAGTTFRDNLFGQGDTLPAHHPARNTNNILID